MDLKNLGILGWNFKKQDRIQESTEKFVDFKIVTNIRTV